MINLQVSIGEQIRARRQSLHMSANQLAKAVGCTRQESEDYELGRKRPSPRLLWDFAAQMGVPLSYFFQQLARRDAPQWGVANKPTSTLSGSTRRS
jgi:transcriptional regulator with XRE-family HTH domain